MLNYDIEENKILIAALTQDNEKLKIARDENENAIIAIIDRDEPKTIRERSHARKNHADDITPLCEENKKIAEKIKFNNFCLGVIEETILKIVAADLQTLFLNNQEFFSKTPTRYKKFKAFIDENSDLKNIGAYLDISEYSIWLKCKNKTVFVCDLKNGCIDFERLTARAKITYFSYKSVVKECKKIYIQVAKANKTINDTRDTFSKIYRDNLSYSFIYDCLPDLVIRSNAYDNL